ncbi:hypothetical protein [Nonomuraea turcica]|uniref:hypothetical protein n=1 Tax=Nonomuraea sp. G32 TaxID=3067274 RepID=UPI00273C8DAA|nr:hypothetical protein [Nonomuraea sp. G32]MDP4503211.1 hypothetical protein [Nonomuraea sp. G32]
MAALLVTAVAGLTSILSRRWGFTVPLDVPQVDPAVSPLWFTAACVVSAGLLWWLRLARGVWASGLVHVDMRI